MEPQPLVRDEEGGGQAVIQRVATLYQTAQGGFVNLADVCASFVERVRHGDLQWRDGWGWSTNDLSFVPWPDEECVESFDSPTCGRLHGFVWVVFIRVRGGRHREAYSLHKTEPEARDALSAMRSEALKCTVEVRS